MNINRFLNFLRTIKQESIRRAGRLFLSFGEVFVDRKVKAKVFSGPFRTMKFIHQDVFGSATAKMLGTYELELEPLLEKIKSTSPEVILNIGGAEGYYAVGFASVWKSRTVIVYESLEEGRSLIAANARLNRVEAHIDIRSLCTEEELYQTLVEDNIDFVVMDVEGAEMELLTERVVKKIKEATILIESHDFCKPGCLEFLKQSLIKTHNLNIVNSCLRNYSDFPYPSLIFRKVKEMLMDEERPGTMQWLIGFPKNNGSN